MWLSMVVKMVERREYEKAAGDTTLKRRQLVKLPGETRHRECSDSAEVIARKIRLNKAERRLRSLKYG